MVEEVYRTKVMDLARESPFLMHALIATSACHHHHLGVDNKAFRYPELLHLHHASHGLRNGVTSIKGARDADSVLTTAMLLNSLTFCAADYRDDAALTVQGNHMLRFDWLRIQIGMTALLKKTAPFHPDSIWMPMFRATVNFKITEPTESNLGEELYSFCEFSDEDSATNNPYFEIAEALRLTVSHKATEQYLPLYLNTIGAITHEFINLMEKHDTKALMLFTHWLALMCSVNKWWSVRRTTRECWRICDILCRSLEPKDMKLLERPAKACGYPLSHEITLDTA